MTRPEEVALRFAQAVERTGETVTLRRRKETSSDFDSVQVPAVMDAFAAQQQPTPQLKQSDQQWLIAEVSLIRRGWVTGIKQGDQLVFADGNRLTIETIDVNRIGSTTIYYAPWGRGD